eukprot:6201989-Pleurochrysis_carterae.AAC.1
MVSIEARRARAPLSAVAPPASSEARQPSPAAGSRAAPPPVFPSPPSPRGASVPGCAAGRAGVWSPRHTSLPQRGGGA